MFEEASSAIAEPESKTEETRSFIIFGPTWRISKEEIAEALRLIENAAFYCQMADEVTAFHRATLEPGFFSSGFPLSLLCL